MPDFLEYRKSISQELISIKDRLMNIIDNHHWGEDGRYKEIILSDILRKYLPQNVTVATGFVMGAENRMSTQIDIIIYNNNYPVLFKQSDFVVVCKESVVGIIEVKSKLDCDKTKSAILKSHQNGLLIGNQIFNGIFGYETDISFINRLVPSINCSLQENSGYLNYICFGKDYFMKYWGTGNPREHDQISCYSFYEINDLSFGYFIANLIEDTYIQHNSRPIGEVLRKSLYPIEETKEAYRLEGFEIKLNR